MDWCTASRRGRKARCWATGRAASTSPPGDWAALTIFTDRFCRKWARSAPWPSPAFVLCFALNWREVRRFHRDHPEQPRDFAFQCLSVHRHHRRAAAVARLVRPHAVPLQLAVVRGLSGHRRPLRPPERRTRRPSASWTAGRLPYLTTASRAYRVLSAHGEPAVTSPGSLPS